MTGRLRLERVGDLLALVERGGLDDLDVGVGRACTRTEPGAAPEPIGRTWGRMGARVDDRDRPAAAASGSPWSPAARTRPGRRSARWRPGRARAGPVRPRVALGTVEVVVLLVDEAQVRHRPAEHVLRHQLLPRVPVTRRHARRRPGRGRRRAPNRAVPRRTHGRAGRAGGLEVPGHPHRAALEPERVRGAPEPLELARRRGPGPARRRT